MTTDGERSGFEVPQSPPRPAQLHPFRALRLSPDRVADLATLRPMSRPYRQAARRLSSWEEAGRLSRDDDRALHLHEYSSMGITVRGLVGALDLSRRAATPEDRAILPHEAVHPEQADELAERMASLSLNPAPILLVHRGSPDSRAALTAIAAGPPDHRFTDHTGQQHRQWRVTCPEHLQVLADGLARNALLIADGHHRYAAYLRLQAQHPGTGWDRGLAMVVDQDDTPLYLGAIHRVFHGLSLRALAEVVTATGGASTGADRPAAVAALSPHAWAATDGTDWLTIRPACGAATAVEHLHHRLLPRLEVPPVATTYRHTVEEAERDARQPGSIAVLLPAPSFSQVERASLEGRLLPEKATSFQPKPSLGVYMRAIRN